MNTRGGNLFIPNLGLGLSTKAFFLSMALRKEMYMKKRWVCLMASLFTLFSLTGCNQIKSAASKGYEKWKQKQYDYLDSVGGKKSNVKFNSCEYVYIEASGTMAVGTMEEKLWTSNYCQIYTC